jgi:hypothetical protein
VPGPEFKPLIAKTFFFQKLKKKKKTGKKKSLSCIVGQNSFSEKKYQNLETDSLSKSARKCSVS